MKKKYIIIPVLFFSVMFLTNVLYSKQDTDDWTSIKEINSTYHEFSPTVSPDGTYLIFDSNRPGGEGDKDLWISYYRDNKWSRPENLSVLNSEFHDQEPFITYDGNALLFTSDRDGGYGVGDIYIAYKRNETWSAPLNLGPKINTKDSEKMPSLSMDNKELFFARIPVDYTSRTLLKDQIQIYTALIDNFNWLEPVKLSEPVNQMTFDCAPRIMPDNRTLLFCSARDGGRGSYDIWKVKRNKREEPWKDLENISDINTPGNEAYFTFNIKGDRLYMASIWSNKNYDIYEKIIPEPVIDPTITLQGRVTNIRTGEAVEAAVSIELFKGKGEKFTIKSDKTTGRYSVTLPEGGDFSVTVEAPKYMFYNHRIDLTKLKKASITNINIGLHPLLVGEKIIINNIYFDGDSYELREDSCLSLDRAVTLLKEYKEIRILIKGHVAKTIGGKWNPQELSQKRAEAVRDYLIRKDIAADRLEAKGYGDSQPIGDNSMEEGRIKNRRTEFEILP